MSFDLVINGKTVKANYGETLVDAGLSGWVAIPHDCNSGQCETCRVSVCRNPAPASDDAARTAQADRLADELRGTRPAACVRHILRPHPEARAKRASKDGPKRRRRVGPSF